VPTPLPKSIRKRIEILKSATAAFRRGGYHGATVDQIARALGMTKGNLYYYFKNKEEILFACHDYALDAILGRLSQIEASDLPPDRKVHQLIVDFVHLFLDEMQGTAWTLDLDALSPPLLKKVIAKRDRFDRGFRRILEDGMKTGVFAPGDPKLLTFAMLGAINWIPRWFDPAGKARPDEIAYAFADFLVGGLMARSSEERMALRAAARVNRSRTHA
jgi:AcrR family transcriptional regulator